VHNFDTAKSAVIIFDAQIKNGFHIVKEFRGFLKDNEINCSVFAYMNQKEIPKDMVFWKGYHIITRRNLNWYMQPVGEDVEQFKQEEPDILFDFSIEPLIELQFLVQLSSARFKIGCFTEEKNDYDLMINLSEQNDMAYLSEQIKHYVGMLNPSK
ncbi:MAG: hypothetical protein U9R49_12420, partial [Bacteroidota bacterium]|nr:hypothetical protein [Bacteroidota bacterium]